MNEVLGPKSSVCHVMIRMNVIKTKLRGECTMLNRLVFKRNKEKIALFPKQFLIFVSSEIMQF